MKYKLEVRVYEMAAAYAAAPEVCKPETAYEVVRDDFSPVTESMHLLILDTKNRVIEKVLIAKGTHNCLCVTPADILHPVLFSAGRHMILAHNHPSGNVAPSEEDIRFTKKVIKAAQLLGIQFLDHLVYSNSEFYSFKIHGLL
jgi:DNA repair protein RadC